MTRDHFDPDWKRDIERGRELSTEAKAALEAREHAKKAFEAVARTPEGKVMFNALMRELGFKDSTIPGASVLNKDDILCNESRRRVWIQIRALIPVDLRNVIEQDEEV